MSDERLPDGLVTPPRVCQQPGCEAVAEVAWEFTWRSSGGITPGARMQCASGHWLTWTGQEIQDPFEEEVLPPDLWDRD